MSVCSFSSLLLLPAFGRTDFFADFIFELPDCSPHSVGKKCPEKSSRKSPGKSSEIFTTKFLQHISADWLRQLLPGAHEAAVLLSAIVAKKMCFLHSNELLS